MGLKFFQSTWWLEKLLQGCKWETNTDASVFGSHLQLCKSRRIPNWVLATQMNEQNSHLHWTFSNSPKTNIGIFEHWNIWKFEQFYIGTFEHWNFWTFEHSTFNQHQSASWDINCVKELPLFIIFLILIFFRGEEDLSWSLEQIIWTFLQSVIIVIAIMGNAMVLWIILAHRRHFYVFLTWRIICSFLFMTNLTKFAKAISNLKQDLGEFMWLC